MTSQRVNLIRSPYVVAILGAIILMLYTFINGYSFVFSDSRSYIRGPALMMKYVTGVDVVKEWPNGVLLVGSEPVGDISSTDGTEAPDSSSAIEKNRPYTANRSIYYGLLAFTGYELSDSWLTVFFQAYLVAVPIALLVTRCLAFSSGTFLIIIALLSLFTSVGIFAGLIMPDITSAAMILSFAILFAYWRSIKAVDKVVLSAILILAALSHPSNLVVLLSFAVIGLLVILFSRSFRYQFAPVAVASAALVVGVLGVVAFNKAVEHATGHKPIVLPHVMAGLIYKGPGYDYLVAHCPHAGFVVCRYLDRLPTRSVDDFLSADPKMGVYSRADIDTQRRLSEEQYPFFIAVLEDNPLGVARSMLQAGLSQLVYFPVGDLKVTDDFMADYTYNFPARMTAKIANATFTREPRLFDLMTLLTYLASAAAAVMVARHLIVSAKSAECATRQLQTLNGLFVFGLVSNAFVCGMINSPIPRYQARVIWLLPLLALVDLAYRRATVRATDARQYATDRAGAAV